MADRQASVDYGRVTPWYLELSEGGRARVDSRLRELAQDPSRAPSWRETCGDVAYVAPVRADGRTWRLCFVVDPAMQAHAPALLVVAVREVGREAGRETRR